MVLTTQKPACKPHALNEQPIQTDFAFAWAADFNLTGPATDLLIFTKHTLDPEEMLHNPASHPCRRITLSKKRTAFLYPCRVSCLLCYKDSHRLPVRGTTPFSPAEEMSWMYTNHQECRQKWGLIRFWEDTWDSASVCMLIHLRASTQTSGEEITQRLTLSPIHCSSRHGWHVPNSEPRSSAVVLTGTS